MRRDGRQPDGGRGAGGEGHIKNKGLKKRCPWVLCKFPACRIVHVGCSVWPRGGAVGAGPGSSVLYSLHHEETWCGRPFPLGYPEPLGAHGAPQTQAPRICLFRRVDTGEFVVSAKGGSESHCSPRPASQKCGPLACWDRSRQSVPWLVGRPAHQPARLLPRCLGISNNLGGRVAWCRGRSRLLIRPLAPPTRCVPHGKLLPLSGPFSHHLG